MRGLNERKASYLARRLNFKFPENLHNYHIDSPYIIIVNIFSFEHCNRNKVPFYKVVTYSEECSVIVLSESVVAATATTCLSCPGAFWGRTEPVVTVYSILGTRPVTPLHQHNTNSLQAVEGRKEGRKEGTYLIDKTTMYNS